MNGTVTPSVVVVVSTSSSAGGFFGSYSWNAPPLLFEVVPGSAAPSWDEPFLTYRKRYDGAWLHFASFALVWQVHGLIWGPASTGPPIGWFVTYSRAALPPEMRAVSGTRPTGSLRTRPSSVRVPVRWRDDVTLRLPALSRRRLFFAPRGSVTRTSASPPETRSARFDSTLMVGAGMRASAGAAVSSVKARATSAGARRARSVVLPAACQSDCASLARVLEPRPRALRIRSRRDTFAGEEPNAITAAHTRDSDRRARGAHRAGDSECGVLGRPKSERVQ